MIRPRSIVLFPALVLALQLSVRAQDAGASPPAAGTDTIPIDVFVLELDRLIATIDVTATPAAAAHLASTIPERWRVRTRTETVDVSARWLTSSLVEAQKRVDWTSARADIRRRIAAVRDETRELATVDSRQARSDARGAIGGILARKEFRESAATRWRDELLDRFWQWLDALWSRFGGGPTTGRRIATVLAWSTAIAALIGLGFWLARSIAERPRGSALNLRAGGAVRPRARELALRALAAARAGNAREAVRCGYNAALVQLEEDGAWKVDDARTPREYLPMLHATDARRPLVQDLTQRFEQIWYGNRAVTAEDTPRVAAHLETLGCLRPGERAI